MIISLPGDPLWLREGVLVISDAYQPGMPIGIILHKPCRGIFIERKTINSKNYIKAYVDDVGERYIEETEVIELVRGNND